MKATVFTKTGTKASKQVELSKEVFEVEVNSDLLNKAIRVYLSNQRQANAVAKTRGEVRGGGKKPWRQKGTGRARAGSLRSPIFKGGGVTFGPTKEDNYKLKLNKKERGAAIKSAFSAQAKDNTVVVFEGFDIKDEAQSKTLRGILDKAKLEGNILIIQGKNDQNLKNAANNLNDVNSEVVNSINAYIILNTKNIVITKEALELIEKMWGQPKSEKQNKEEKTIEKNVTKKTDKETKKKVTKEAKVKSTKNTKTK